jgi:hypothetical protein
MAARVRRPFSRGGRDWGAHPRKPLHPGRGGAQAGIVQGNFLAEMASAVRRDGIGALYWGFFSFCMESLPYDVVELVGFGGRDARGARSGVHTPCGLSRGRAEGKGAPNQGGVWVTEGRGALLEPLSALRTGQTGSVLTHVRACAGMQGTQERKQKQNK